MKTCKNCDYFCTDSLSPKICLHKDQDNIGIILKQFLMLKNFANLALIDFYQFAGRKCSYFIQTEEIKKS